MPGKTPKQVANEINHLFKHPVLVQASALDKKVERISWGILTLDAATGGCPLGRVIELYGPESSGKSTLAICLAVQHQRNRRELSERFHVPTGIAYLDLEGTFDRAWAQSAGLDMNDPHLFYAAPHSGEEALDTVVTLMESGAYGLIIFDSVAAACPQGEIDGSMEQSQVALGARLMNKGFRKFTAAANRSGVKTTLLLLNQIRIKIGVVYGDPEMTPGGQAMKFQTSMRLRIHQAKKEYDVRDKDSTYPAVAMRGGFRVTKSKVGSYGANGHYVLGLVQGGQLKDSSYGLQRAQFDNFGASIDIARELRVTEEAPGGWIVFQGSKYHGRAAFEQYLLENPEEYGVLYACIEAEIAKRHTVVEEEREDDGAKVRGKAAAEERSGKDQGGRKGTKAGKTLPVRVQADYTGVVSSNAGTAGQVGTPGGAGRESSGVAGGPIGEVPGGAS